MRRRHLFEFNESDRCPDVVRRSITRLLQWGALRFGIYAPAAELIRELLEAHGGQQIVDLGAGSGGPWPALLREPALAGVGLRLTDRALDARALDAFDPDTRARVALGPEAPRFLPGAELDGLRTAFACLHHLTPDALAEALGRVARDRFPFLAIEVTERTWCALVRQVVFGPLALWGIACLRPTPGQILLTYVIPVIPLALVWDGCVSCLRSYGTEELLALARRHARDDYVWDAGILRPPGGAALVFLRGRPTATAHEEPTHRPL